MKLKIALSAATALALTMGVAWAGQNESDINQTGTSGRVDVLQRGQSGEIGLNQGGGSGNKAKLTQDGTDNWIGDDDSAAPNSAARSGPIVQDGSNNSLEINQAGTNNDVDQGLQQGGGNFLKIDQSGTGGSGGLNNTITFSQISNANANNTGQGNGSRGSADNFTSRYDARDAKSYNPFGVSNYSSVSGGTNQWGYIEQTGTDNNLSLRQEARDAGVWGNGVNAHQTGSNGSIELIQLGGNSYSYFDQRGNLNSVFVDQFNDMASVESAFNIIDARQGGGAGADGNSINARQYGSSQELFIDQTNTSGSNATTFQVNGSNSNVISIEQDGAAHMANATQAGSGNGFLLKQNGSGNMSTSSQGGDNNDATVMQTGNMNTSNLMQDGSSGIALINQSGNGNRSDVNQMLGGSNLYASVSQMGNDNVSDVDQAGDNNQAFVMQTNNANNSSLSQSGSGNVANITQQ